MIPEVSRRGGFALLFYGMALLNYRRPPYPTILWYGFMGIIVIVVDSIRNM